MWNRLVSSSLIYLFLALSVLLAVLISFALQNRVILPLLDVAFAYPLLFSLIAWGQRRRAINAMLFWALCLAVATVAATIKAPEYASSAIFHGPEYRDEMFHWIRTGIGAEGNPSQFIPQHLLHLAVFSVLSVLSASFLSLLMGAMLMNYMSFYVGSLVASSSFPVMTLLMGWHPWSIVRVVSFVILGVILGEPLISRLSGRRYDYGEAKWYFWVAISGLIVDIGMKALLAPWWGAKLRDFL